MGLLYVLDGDTGYVRRHFPMQFGPIECQIAIADLLGDGELEIIVTDMNGNVVIVSASGEVLWDIQLPSMSSKEGVVSSIPYTPAVADIDSDGQLDIVVVTMETSRLSHTGAQDTSTRRHAGDSSNSSSSGSTPRSKPRQRGGVVWALNGATGKVLTGYPIALPKGAVVSAGIIPLDLHDYR